MVEMNVQLILVINKVTRQSSVYLVRRAGKILDSIPPKNFWLLCDLKQPENSITKNLY